MSKIKSFFSNWLSYLVLAFVVIAAFYLRVYKIGDLMGFYYDQGRDALVIWNLWHSGKFFLIGPVTGLSGIFLGPFYYFLIAPLYLIGGGNPLLPMVFLAILSALSLLLIFELGRQIHSRSAGLIAAVVAGFSYYIIYYSRWLSNPNPMLLLSMIFFYSLWKIISGGRRRWWPVSAFVVGVSLHFESASAFFYLFIYSLFILWFLIRYLKGLKGGLIGSKFWHFVKLNSRLIIVSCICLLVTFIPQIIFNFRHDNLLMDNFLKLFTEEKAFSKPLTVSVLETRIAYFWSAFMGKIFIGWNKQAYIFAALSLASLILGKKHLAKGTLPLFSIFLITPMLGYILFQGNFGNIYDYYLIGYFLPFILLFSIGLAEFSTTLLGKLLLLLFFVYFFRVNMIPIRAMIKNPMDGPTDIKLGSQIRAVDWVFENAAGRGVYNVDVYVPPVIPYAYDYLFLWQGWKKCGESLCGKVDYTTSMIYTLYEQDPPNPQRLKAWLDNQQGASFVEEEARFGGITVQRRRRL